MRLGIMQPYFFPYIGYFSLIKHVDRFIILDEVQFIRHGWIERNRIKKQSEGWQYISVSLQKHSQKTLIKDIKINNSVEWKNKILAQLSHYKKAPYYNNVIGILEDVFRYNGESITELDMITLKKVAEYLNIETPIQLYSDLGLEIEEVKAADEWALHICNAMNQVTEYWNPSGGQSFFDRTKYENAGINLYFQEMELLPYKQFGNKFEKALSILDVMMFNNVDDIHFLLDRYQLK